MGRKHKHINGNAINYIRKNGGINMYYYGGYQGYGNACCNQGCGGGYGGGYGYGAGYGAAIILVLFILLVIVIGARAFNCGNSCNSGCGGR